MQAPEDRLGSFYLGANYDLDTSDRSEIPVDYDARDLTTHAVCVGMTGSGKTGLCIGLLEEAALDRVPAILIDPKGDITNLLLQFPDFEPEDFLPWINVDDARRKGKTADEYAKSMADTWRDGLADWGITSERIKTLQETTKYSIFTPGSDAGIPINLLGSLAAPKLDFDANAEALRERIAGTVAALLGLVDVKADPMRSREAILLATIFEHFWRQGEDLDLTKLIMSIQNPPVRQIGVFDVDTYYPEKARFDLAMTFNNLMASPTFQSWLQGEPLDIDRLFFTESGGPRHSIFYIAHLSDSERMFFVTLLLESIVTWMRGQTGTTSLRALLYFDEVFGFFPPSAEPPSKRPLLTLLKQARAFGLGLVLVTQNPVDLDYKGLTNAGTWFIGKLQAERDKERVLSGLKGAIAEAGSSSKVDYDELISRLRSRVFLLHNVHQDKPIVFHTRWVHSYLRCPLTRPQVGNLMADQPKQPTTAHPKVTAVAPQPTSSPAVPVTAEEVKEEQIAAPLGFSAILPALGSGVEQIFLPVTVSARAAIREVESDLGRKTEVESLQLLYEPAVIGATGVRFVDRKREINEKMDRILLAPIPTGVGGIDWEDAEVLPVQVRDLESAALETDPEEGPFFAAAPEEVNTDRELRSIGKDLSDWLYYNSRMKINVHEELGLFQEPDEREREFTIRLQHAARERRDMEVDKLELQFERQIDKLAERMQREERELAEDEADYSARKQEEFVGIGESVLGYFMGRRNSTIFSRAATKRRMTTKARLDIDESKEVIAELQEDIAELEEESKDRSEEITVKWADLLDDITVEELKPRRTDVDVELVALAWVPSWLVRYNDGVRSGSSTVAAYPLPEPN